MECKAQNAAIATLLRVFATPQAAQVYKFLLHEELISVSLTLFSFFSPLESFMKKNTLAVAALLAAALALPVAAQNLAVVNGKAIPQSRADALKQQIERSNPGRPFPPEMEGQLKEELIMREIFMQEAQKRGLEGSDEFKSQMELARESLLIRELFNNYQAKNPVSDKEVKAEYDKLAAENQRKEYKVSHILVETEEEAKEIVAQLKKKGKFEDIAKDRSKDPGSSENGGAMDWSSPNTFVAEFSAALTKLEKGKYTEEPVQSQFGWHIIRLDDERKEEMPKLEDIKPQVEQHLQQQKLAKFQEELRAKAKIE